MHIHVSLIDNLTITVVYQDRHHKARDASRLFHRSINRPYSSTRSTKKERQFLLPRRPNRTFPAEGMIHFLPDSF